MKESLSRRHILFGGSAALIAATLPGAAHALEGAALDTTTKHKNSLSRKDRKVSVISSSSPKFKRIIKKHFSSLKDDPIFASLLSVTAIIQHKAGPPLRGYTFCCEVTTPVGISHFGFKKISCTPLNKKSGLVTSAQMAAQNDILSAGEFMLVSPFFCWNSSWFKRRPLPDWYKLTSHSQRSQFMLSVTQSATSVKMWLDAALFSDNKLIGPNQHRLGRYVVARCAAEKAVAERALLLAHTAGSAVQVKQTLRKLTSTPRPEGNPRGYKRVFKQAARGHALAMLRMLRHDGPQSFVDHAKRLQHMNTPIITRMAKA